MLKFNNNLLLKCLWNKKFDILIKLVVKCSCILNNILVEKQIKKYIGESDI